MKPRKTENFLRAMESLEDAIALPVQNQRDMAGIIQNFECVYELGWKMLKERLEEQGIIANSPKEVLEKAYQVKFIEEENLWLEIIKARNLSTHTYDRELAEKLVLDIKSKFMKAFLNLKNSI